MEASDTVGELLTLQEIDLQILNITKELTAYDAELADLQATVDDLEAAIAQASTVKAEADERVRRYQRAVQAGRATLKRLETKASAVENMQQHFAVRTETETARRNLRVAEDEALDAMQDVESSLEKIADLEARLTEARGALDGRSAEIAGQRAGLERELAEHNSSAETQRSRLDRRSLRLYESVSGGSAARALAALTADGACGHCFTAVPKQRQADIRAGRDLAVCEGCGVILYADGSSD